MLVFVPSCQQPNALTEGPARSISVDLEACSSRENPSTNGMDGAGPQDRGKDQREWPYLAQNTRTNRDAVYMQLCRYTNASARTIPRRVVAEPGPFPRWPLSMTPLYTSRGILRVMLDGIQTHQHAWLIFVSAWERAADSDYLANKLFDGMGTLCYDAIAQHSSTYWTRRITW